MTDFERLESMGYRFKLNGDKVIYSIYGGKPPPGGAELMQRLDREEVKRILQDRAAGFKVLHPPELDQGWPPVPDISQELKAAYRAAFDFHRRHNGAVDDWEAVCRDMKETAHRGQNKPFLQALLLAVYEELGRRG